MFPLPVWIQGTTQPSTPVNDSFLRTEVLARGATSILSAPPGSPVDGQVHIVGASPTGAWSTFAQHDVVLWRSGTWYRFAPFLGWLKQVGGDVRRFDGSAWVVVTGGGGSSVWDGQIVMDSDFTVNNTASQNVAIASGDVKFSPLANSVYEFEALCLVRSDDTAVGARPGIRWPTDAEGGVMVIAANSNTAATFAFRTSFDVTQPRADTTTFPAPAAGRQFAFIRGILTTTAFTSGDLWLTMAGETTASVIMGRGSLLRWKKLA